MLDVGTKRLFEPLAISREKVEPIGNKLEKTMVPIGDESTKIMAPNDQRQFAIGADSIKKYRQLAPPFSDLFDTFTKPEMDFQKQSFLQGWPSPFRRKKKQMTKNLRT